MKIAMLLSGGVDSSVAMALLKEQGHQVVAFYLKIWLEEEFRYLGECPWEEDLSYARATCEHLGVELNVVPLQTAYWDQVVAYTVQELKMGRTPSPDVLCNERVKFGAFLEHVPAGFDRIATGHYATVERGAEQVRLMKGRDPVKDQSYFLSQLSQDQLAGLEFPLGRYRKDEIRAMARDRNLPSSVRPDSQGICFLGKIKYSDFVAQHLGRRPGDIVELETGKVLGRHDGYWFHTIGQRRGLGLGGGPWFVRAKDTNLNLIFVSHKEALSPCRQFIVDSLRWNTTEAPKSGAFGIKVRHGPEIAPASIRNDGDGRMHVTLAEGDQGIAPGQYAVVYQDDYCLGGGTIAEP